MVTQNTNFSPEQPKHEKDEQQNVAIVEFNSSVLSRQSTDFLTHEEALLRNSMELNQETTI
ncbi:hypothetical protein P7245_21280 [Vibrio parahaemolyticus]|nr:hypothetical protein [Vibrio parahaemolyticus]